MKTSYVNPKGASSRRPRCGAMLTEIGYRTTRYPCHGFTGDRDVIACMNLFIKYSRCGVHRGRPERPQARCNPKKGYRGTKMRGGNN